MLKFYNTLSRKKEVFKPLNDKKVGIYSCGPTVYDVPHIGNLRAFLFADLLKRYLEFKEYQVKHVMNITDVDDKLIKKSDGGKEKLKEITKKYGEIFLKNLKKLNIELADFYPKATEHIKEMVEIVKKLLEKGYAYKSEDGIYFSVSKFKKYGELANLKNSGLKAGASGRVDRDEYEKEEVQDFALWKFWKPEDGEIYWETEIGKGRPGWHIECSAMASKYLGESFDIHTGGIDLVFPHHTNEISQSEAVTGKKFVKYWMHNEHVVVDGRKMSKSLGNFFTLEDLEKKGFDDDSIRFLLISTNYRQKLNITDNGLNASQESVKRIKEFLDNSESRKDGKEVDNLIVKAEKDFVDAMDDDLNISEALANLFNFIREANKKGPGKKSHDFILGLNKILGLKIEKIKVPEEIMKLTEEREKARKNKDWKKSDELRDKIKEIGWQVADTPEGPRVRKL